MLTHHFVMTSSLFITILKIDNFGDFSCDIDYNSSTDVFRDVISIIMNQCDPRRPKRASADTKCPPAAQRKQAKHACNIYTITILTIKTRLMYVYLFIYIYISVTNWLKKLPGAES